MRIIVKIRLQFKCTHVKKETTVGSQSLDLSLAVSESFSTAQRDMLAGYVNNQGVCRCYETVVIKSTSDVIFNLWRRLLQAKSRLKVAISSDVVRDLSKISADSGHKIVVGFSIDMVSS